MTTYIGTVEAKRSDQNKRGKIPLGVQICEEGKNEGKMGPERITLKSSLAGTGPEAPGEPGFLLREMQYTTVGKSTAINGSLEQERIIYLQVVVEVKHDSQTSPITTSYKIVILPISWQPVLSTYPLYTNSGCGKKR